MLKKTVTYEDYNGVEKTRDFYFNLSKAELIEMEAGVTGGFTEMVKKLIATQDIPTLSKIFKELVLKSYGEKSQDGERFIKSKELSEAFSQTPAYSIIYTELATDDIKASEFINGLAPKDISEKAKTMTPGDIGVNIPANN